MATHTFETSVYLVASFTSQSLFVSICRSHAFCPVACRTQRRSVFESMIFLGLTFRIAFAVVFAAMRRFGLKEIAPFSRTKTCSFRCF